jgi:hypothetical protein
VDDEFFTVGSEEEVDEELDVPSSDVAAGNQAERRHG